MISSGEISKGMCVTILEWEPIIREPDGIFTMTQTVCKDNSWKGALLDVMAVQLPYIVVNERGNTYGQNITLDTRRVKLMELSSEFIEAKTKKK